MASLLILYGKWMMPFNLCFIVIVIVVVVVVVVVGVAVVVVVVVVVKSCIIKEAMANKKR